MHNFFFFFLFLFLSSSRGILGNGPSSPLREWLRQDAPPSTQHPSECLSDGVVNVEVHSTESRPQPFKPSLRPTYHRRVLYNTIRCHFTPIEQNNLLSISSPQHSFPCLNATPSSGLDIASLVVLSRIDKLNFGRAFFPFPFCLRRHACKINPLLYSLSRSMSLLQ